MGVSESFSSESFWENYGTTSDYKERIALLQSFLPQNIIKLLDVGCGKGEIINSLIQTRPTIQSIGIDGSFSPHRFLKTPFVQASLPDIPFPSKYFDMVLCLQVLEHINPSHYSSSLKELQRVSREQIIIGVPYKEDLDQMQVLCSNCQKRSHAHGHLRSYQKKDMKSLFPEFELQGYYLLGIIVRQGSRIGSFILHHIGKIYQTPQEFVCPYCHGIIPSVSRRNKVIKFLSRKVNEILNNLSPNNPYWIIAYYQRKVN